MWPRPYLRPRGFKSKSTPSNAAPRAEKIAFRRSREAGLFTWDKPAYACLATRIPTGAPITKEDLEKVERAEGALHALGFRDFRVRLFHGAARLQVTEDQLPRALEKQAELRAALRPDFSDVLLDLAPRTPST